MEVTRANLSDLQELAESFSQLRIVELVKIQTNEVTPALPPTEGSICSNEPPQDHPMRKSEDFHTNATPAFVGTRLRENLGRNPRRAPENTPCIYMVRQWREMLIQSYKVPKGQMDSVARRMSFLEDKLKDLCHQASIQKNMKKLRGTIKRTPFCCDNEFPGIIGESGEPRKRKKQNSDSYPRSSRRTSFRWRSWWSKLKARTYKSGQRSGPTRASSQGSR
ncbi:UNVERIFIED_CONTAM: hypothetical protein Sangu_2810900 [Sesamum angustifolium]|uniref:Uncharacterized protein n=1 Tax=Sesamum angustifolium TaxID=2727405 RepID=A0AAW2ITT0_9LAMI